MPDENSSTFNQSVVSTVNLNNLIKVFGSILRQVCICF